MIKQLMLSEPQAFKSELGLLHADDMQSGNINRFTLSTMTTRTTLVVWRDRLLDVKSHQLKDAIDNYPILLAIWIPFCRKHIFNNYHIIIVLSSFIIVCVLTSATTHTTRVVVVESSDYVTKFIGGGFQSTNTEISGCRCCWASSTSIAIVVAAIG